MIENVEAAQLISTAILRINDELEESIRLVQSEITPDELKTYKRAVGHVLYEIFKRILEPLYARHPSLEPGQWED